MVGTDMEMFAFDICLHLLLCSSLSPRSLRSVLPGFLHPPAVLLLFTSPLSSCCYGSGHPRSAFLLKCHLFICLRNYIENVHWTQPLTHRLATEVSSQYLCCCTLNRVLPPPVHLDNGKVKERYGLVMEILCGRFLKTFHLPACK